MCVGVGHHRRSLVVLCFLVALLLLTGCSKDKTTPGPSPASIVTAAGSGAQSAEDYFRQGNTLYAQGNLSEAEQAYKQALALEPNRPEVYTNLGVTYYSMGRLDDAIDSYQTGLKYAPNDAELLYLLGAAYLQQGRLDEAREALLKANQADPNLGEPYYGLGVLYKLEGKREEAIAAFEKFLEIGPAQDPRAIDEAQRELEELRAGQ